MNSIICNKLFDYKQLALNKLISVGIEDKLMIKIKQSNNDFVAMYRSYSQYKNGGRGPIFWLAPMLLENKPEFIISVLHEYGHVMAESAYVNNDKLFSLLKDSYPGRSYNRPWDEEQFAEDFAQEVYNNFLSKKMFQIIQQYIQE